VSSWQGSFLPAISVVRRTRGIDLQGRVVMLSGGPERRRAVCDEVSSDTGGSPRRHAYETAPGHAALS
jgi:hypothetical protein